MFGNVTKLEQTRAYQDIIAIGRLEGERKGKLEGKAEGVLEGQIKERISLVRTMLERGATIEQIVQLTGMTIEDITKVRL